jgi:hypothetical protein
VNELRIVCTIETQLKSCAATKYPIMSTSRQMKSPTPGPHGELCSCRGWGPHVYSQKRHSNATKKNKKRKKKKEKTKTREDINPGLFVWL